jgi:hypothetical protein
MKDVAPSNSNNNLLSPSRRLHSVSLKKMKMEEGELSFSKIIVDEDLFVRECKDRQCDKCGLRSWSHKWKTYGKGISPSVEMKCSQCGSTCQIDTSRKWLPPNDASGKSKMNYNNAQLNASIIMSGLTLTPVCVISVSTVQLNSHFRPSISHFRRSISHFRPSISHFRL